MVWLTRYVFCFEAQAERQAVNTTIQGSAADIAKAAMLRVSSTVRRRKLQAQLVINLHDELIYEVSFSLVNFYNYLIFKYWNYLLTIKNHAFFVMITYYCLDFIHCNTDSSWRTCIRKRISQCYSERLWGIERK